ncbi:MAG: hypothetical protein U5J63_12455 [Fodinibius sp.]|nr:hypothetical protein [Fodinibius sp.]
MKKVSFLLIGLIITATLISCDQTKITDSQDKKLDIEKLETYLDKTGKLHNKGLDFAYKKLKEKEASKSVAFKSKTSTLNFVKSTTIEFLKQSESKLIKNNTKAFIKSAEKMISRKKKRASQTQSTQIKLWEPKISDSLSAVQKKYLSKLNTALSNSNFGFQDKINAFKNIKATFKKEAPKKEQFVLLAAAQVGINSLQYWHENKSKWKDLMKNSKSIQLKESDGSITEADVDGAVTGAIGVGVYTLYAGPPGWAGAAGSVLTGAAAGSTYQAIKNMF